MKKYQIIYADPPWKYWAGGWKNAARHYHCLSLEEICALPVSSIADDNCALFLWVTYPILPDSFKVMSQWGFTYSTCAFTWVKTTTGGKYHFGCGNWTRANPELCLLATKGRLKRQDASIRNLVISPIGKHSQKPEIIRERITLLLGELPRVELFAREKPKGWDVWGNEVESDIEL